MGLLRSVHPNRSNRIVEVLEDELQGTPILELAIAAILNEIMTGQPQSGPVPNLVH